MPARHPISHVIHPGGRAVLAALPLMIRALAATTGRETNTAGLVRANPLYPLGRVLFIPYAGGSSAACFFTSAKANRRATRHRLHLGLDWFGFDVGGLGPVVGTIRWRWTDASTSPPRRTTRQT